MTTSAILTRLLAGPRIVATGVFVALACTTAASAQAPVDTIHGRVRDALGVAVTSAQVSVTVPPQMNVINAETNVGGEFVVLVAGGPGDYLVRVGAAGFVSRAVRARRSALGHTIELDVRMGREETMLKAIVVTAQKPRPSRKSGLEPGIGAAETVADGVAAALESERQGDPSAAAATIGGVQALTNGVSMLGLPAEQNSTTLNGLTFDAILPRDAKTQTRVTQSVYDASRGGFSGGQIAVELAPGGAYSTRRGRVTADGRPLQIEPGLDRIGGASYSQQSLSGGMDGPLSPVGSRWFYSAAGQLSRLRQAAPSTLSADPTMLGAAGLSDSTLEVFRRVVGTLDPRGAGQFGMDVLSAMGRLDHTPNADDSFGFVGVLNGDQQTRVAFSPLSTPSHGGDERSASVALQGYRATLYRKEILSDSRIGAQLKLQGTSPYSSLPEGVVLAQTTTSPSLLTASTVPLLFGGNASLGGSSRSITLQGINELQSYVNAQHLLKTHVEATYDGTAMRSPSNSINAYSYSSLADLVANQPSMFVHTTQAGDVTGDVWGASVAATDVWRATTGLEVIYGVRIDASRFGRTPMRNETLTDILHLRNDAAPSDVTASPRLGLTWNYGGRAASVSEHGPLGTLTPLRRGTVRAGAGLFRGAYSPRQVLGSMQQTGLPSGDQGVVCLGAAVPIPDWPGLFDGSVRPPEQCASGSSGSPFAQGAPNVAILGQDFKPPRSWRASVGWSGHLPGAALDINAIRSLNLDQSSVIDANLNPVAKFRLDDEAARPVFVDPAAIDPSSGLTVGGGSTLTPDFRHVLVRVSDLRSSTNQLTLGVTPDLNFGLVFSRLSYTLSRNQGQSRGLEGGAWGDPNSPEWATGDLDVRHQINLQVGLARRAFIFTMFASVNSGYPYTPMVRSDINGDGFANDRAFVFATDDPSRPDVSRDMRNLIANAPANARECLSAQTGRPAERNSCRGPWRQLVNARLTLNSQALHISNRARVSLDVVNAPALLDRALHGVAGARGWGNPSQPDAVLLEVVGFDATQKRYYYRVNSHFGQASSASMLARNPTGLRLEVSVDLGRPIPEQQITRLLAPGRTGNGSQALTVAQLEREYATGYVPDVYRLLFRFSDSLLLSNAQIDALQRASAAYNARTHVVWQGLAEYLAALPRDYDRAEAYRRQEDATDRVYRLSYDEESVVKGILSAEQFRLAPLNVIYILETKGKIPLFGSF